ncbi:MAG TPA: penicillin-binding transpeptidase domain-containing protein [Solirubrobacteraceae bacterium]|nr:penicillin-binding transpeptidase domain-containing protein [Solirubrobacteraceae bacterium]
MSFTEPPEDPRARANLNPALALRVGIVGSIILGLFAIIFFRLWFLQVLSGPHYVEAAAKNTTQQVAIAPPRGEILARNGQTALVTSTTQLAAVIVPESLPVKVNPTNLLDHFPQDDAVYDRLARLLHKSTKPRPCVVAVPPPSCNTSTTKCPPSTTRDLSPIACTVAQSIALNRYADVTVAEPVSHDLEYYVAERATEFRGVEIEQATTSGYPFGPLAAQTLGTVGRLTQAEHSQPYFKGVNLNAIVGQSGLEYEYDKYLRGTYGHQNVLVNASGIAVGQGRKVEPIPGDNLRTSLDVKLQQVGQQALQHSIDLNGGLGGAFVAMNPQNGSIYAMGSNPSFNPKIFTGQISPQEAHRLFSSSSNAPLFNRATQSAVPTGSTFKAITSIAALQSGVWTTGGIYDDTGEFCPAGSGIPPCFHNAGHVANGPIDLTTAIKLSDDVFFYHLGDLLNNPRPQGGALQRWAHLFGVGRNPHIDLPPAEVSDGLMPTPAWFDQRVRLEVDCERATGPYRYTNGHGGISATPRKGYHRSPKHPYDAATGTGGCGIAVPGTTWTVGDNINAAVGQGDDGVSPLQLAVVYSAVENGGTIVRPHLGQDIQAPDGTILQKLSFPPLRHLHINPTYLQTVQTGLHEAAQSPGGTSADVMTNFGKPVYGKTGTAQYIPTSGPDKGIEKDYSWYTCYVPASATSKPIEIVVWVEGGGFGAVASAPVARQMLSQWFYGRPGPYTAGSSQTN